MLLFLEEPPYLGVHKSNEQQAVYLKGLSDEIEVKSLSMITLYVNNQGAKQFAQNPVFYARMKHIDIRHYFVRDTIDEEMIRLEHIYLRKIWLQMSSRNLYHVFAMRAASPTSVLYLKRK